ncbi:peptidyl-prolyl cis-trans isomerase [Paenibacillus sp. LHD-38]|uniref:peptidylprolyl isomerase n=1 Tax=Paenibacillus sp. LHD-38 TaxID=3072143 RepID=UPI0028101BCD|nr:peptidyl-prolyl cis-trans isomerase [Paenibacillus sp. LHD-38]MDQ8737999.1 peptidyl-prolyl cis-trans isomerase [Paenibacillus sp. LHD-38]
MKKLAIAAGMVCLLAGIGWVFGGSCAVPVYPEAPVAIINGLDVSASEFEAAMAQERTTVIQFFQSRYGAEYGEGFWQAEFDGTTPLDALKDKALNRIARVKVQQAESLRQGIDTPVSYEQFLTQWEKENERRKKAVLAGEVIYGPVAYGEEDYYRHMLSNLAIALKEKLALGGLSPKPSEIEAYYEANQDAMFKKPDAITILKLFIPYSESSQEEARAAAESARAAAERAGSLEAAADERKLALTEQRFGADSERNDRKTFAEILQAAEGLAVGGISEVVALPDGYAVLECLEREEGGYYPLDEVTEEILYRLLDLKYEQWLVEAAREAAVTVHAEALAKLSADKMS